MGQLHTLFVSTPPSDNNEGVHYFASSGQTTNATLTTVETVTINEGETVLVEVEILARKSDLTQGACYILRRAFRRASGGNATALGALVTVMGAEDDTNWDAKIEASGANIVIQIQGIAATTINWKWRGRKLVY
jgi:hypothetical protein